MATSIRRAAGLLLLGLALLGASPTARAVVCDGTNNGSVCDDGNACTQTDICQNGVCVGSNPVTCTALDQCHAVGTCNPANGVCSNPTRPDGTACNDGNACTQTDVCQAGSCVGSNPVTCTASDQCHAPGTCNPANGTCSNPTRPDGTACNDGNACTQTDVCQTGSCVGSNPVTCTASDQCHDPGTCNPANATCSNPNKPNGTACNDGDLNTVNDVCNNGVCAGLEFHIIQTAVSGANFNVTFSTAAGHQYSLEGSPDLVTWTAINGSAFTGDGNPHTSAVDITSTPNRYFVRVLIGP